MDEDRGEHLPAAMWFVATLVVYIALGLYLKSPVLNWIVGPLWLFGSLYLIPAMVRAARTRMNRR